MGAIKEAGSFLNPNMTGMSVLFCFKRIDDLPQSPLANIQGGWNLKKNKTKPLNQAVIPVLQKLKQEDCKLKTRMSYKVEP